MKRIGKYVAYAILALNAVFTALMTLCAHAPYLHPSSFSPASFLGLLFPLFLIVNLLFLLFWIPVNYRYTLLSLAGCLICFPQIRTFFPLNGTTEELPPKSIKLLSYNVMAFGWMEKDDNGENAILHYLRDSKADIICLQEYCVSVTKDKRYVTERDVRTALKNYPYHNIYEAGTGPMRLACFSKYPILSAHPIRYSSENNGSVAYRLRIDEDTVTIINNHLESNKLTKEDRGVYENIIDHPDTKIVKTGARQLLKKLMGASVIRAAQADSVAQAIERCPDRTIIVCGDFNDTPVSYTHHVLSRTLDDAFTQSGFGPGISYHLSKFYFRIDHILVSNNLRTYNCTIDRSISSSDHYPIWCYLSKR